MNAAETGAALLAAVCERPEDYQTRLIYADWLEDQGEDARAEFIRAQVDGWNSDPDDLERWNTCCNRANELLTPERFEDWVGSLSLFPGMYSYRIRTASKVELYDQGADKTVRLTIRGGFVEEISLPMLDWWRHGKELVKVCPLVRVDTPDRVLEPFSELAFAWNGWTHGSDHWWVETGHRTPRCLPWSLWKCNCDMNPTSIEDGMEQLRAANLKWARKRGR